MEGIFAALNFNGWTFLFQVINLVIVAVLLYFILYKPITQMVAEREHRIEGGLAEAARAREEATTLLSQYQAQLAGARAEAQGIIEQAKKAGDSLREETVAAARQEADKILARAKNEIEASRTQAIAQIRAEAAALTVMAASKVLEREITAADHQRLVEEFIAGAGKLQ
ncbi:MAG: ATP synthase F0 subunit B [Clostridia bacterium]|nr:MAG: ATP synthase F0 subunit B [Clostridia bacterium]